MTQLLTNLQFALSVTSPIVLLMALGALLARLGLLTEGFIDAGSRLVFNVTLPILLFLTISRTPFDEMADVTFVGIGLIGTLVIYLVFELIALVTVNPARDRGVVVQGAYRSNMGIIGLAYAVNAYGDVALGVASLYLAIVTILYNILAVITLNRSLSRHRSVVDTLSGIFRNPLIIGILLALPCAYFEYPLPDLLQQTGRYFAQMTLPLALLCTGGSLSLAALQLESRNAFISTFGKILLSPLLLTALAYLAGFRGIQLGVVFLMSSAPSAASGYVMVRAMGGNAALSANIVVLSTIGSVIVTTLGMTWLHAAGVIL